MLNLGDGNLGANPDFAINQEDLIWAYSVSTAQRILVQRPKEGMSLFPTQRLARASGFIFIFQPFRRDPVCNHLARRRVPLIDLYTDAYYASFSFLDIASPVKNKIASTPISQEDSPSIRFCPHSQNF